MYLSDFILNEKKIIQKKNVKNIYYLLYGDFFKYNEVCNANQ